MASRWGSGADYITSRNKTQTSAGSVNTHTSSAGRINSISPHTSSSSPANSRLSGGTSFHSARSSGTASFYSARSSGTASFYSVRSLNTTSSRTSHADLSTPSDVNPYAARNWNSEYGRLIKERDLLAPIEVEQNWSGREAGAGQHVEFELTDKIPLEVLRLIGSSVTARVHMVRCRRILLARKSMKCCIKLELKDAINEVDHLQKLRHAHIVQLIGSYVQGKTFAILLYPVADYDLSTFMERVTQALASNPISYREYLALLSFGSFFGCLASALEFIHGKTIKHMDIKPANILVKEHERYENRHHVYIADFGISRSFSQLDHSQTDSKITKTPRYCAPEVYHGNKWGRSADIFSMGCVFLEMHTILCSRALDEFTDYRRHDGMDGSFHANLPRVREWSDSLRKSSPYLISIDQDTPLTMVERNNHVIEVILGMLELDPEKRPKAATLALLFGSSRCCKMGPEILTAKEAVKHGDTDHWGSLFGGDGEILPHLHKERHLKEQACHYVMQKAASNGHMDVVQLLLEKGASAARGYDGRTALECAVLNWHEPIVKLLLEKGADIEAKDSLGRTALHNVVMKGREPIVKLLLEKGVKPDSEDSAFLPSKQDMRRCEYEYQYGTLNDSKRETKIEDSPSTLSYSISTSLENIQSSFRHFHIIRTFGS
ncbi:MAG: hypothetical protein M1839_005034 [Geoglossum umbratile]|nr:MAG: hypothetical protein M1839_005034 [Geoglossum umbratile]